MTENRAFNLLIIDDDPIIHHSLKLLLPKQWRAYSIQNIDLLHFDRFYHAAFVDMHLRPPTAHSEAEGPKIIQKILQRHPNTEVVAISGDLSRDLMEKCLKVGAQRFLPKPFIEEEIIMTLQKIEALWELRSQTNNAGPNASPWIGDGLESQKIKRRIAQLRGESSAILIQGETGSGKEIVARALNHQEGPRPFIAVNMASLPENIFESEMFGHVKGAFTGADSNKIGLIEAASGGDLFLDEIEALPLTQQAKLLRFLESKEIRRVGGKENIEVQVRIISASNRSLKEMVAAGEFREDLYFRLCSQLIELPPLRERTDDIAELARYFLSHVKPRRNKQFTEDAYEVLKKYSWPGNTRELKRVCEQLSLVSPLPLIRDEDVSKWIFPELNSNPPAQPNKASASEKMAVNKDISVGLHQLIANFEAELIRECINEHKDIEKAAQLLKISRSSLYKKIKDHNIDIDE